MATNYNFRVYCVTESAYVNEWKTSEVAPTQCPNNPSHTINGIFTDIPEKITTDKKNQIIPKISTIDNKVFNLIAVYDLPKTELLSFKSVSWMIDTASSYEIKIVNKTNNSVLINTSLNNTTQSLQDLGIITNPPSTEVVIEIFAKITGPSNSKLYIDNISIYYS